MDEESIYSHVPLQPISPTQTLISPFLLEAAHDVRETVDAAWSIFEKVLWNALIYDCQAAEWVQQGCKGRGQSTCPTIQQEVREKKACYITAR